MPSDDIPRRPRPDPLHGELPHMRSHRSDFGVNTRRTAGITHDATRRQERRERWERWVDEQRRRNAQ